MSKKSRDKNIEYYREVSREYYKKNKDRLLDQQRVRDKLRYNEKKDYNKKYQKENKETLALYYRAWRLAKKYNISMDEYEHLFSIQKGVCAICDEKQNATCRNGTRPLHVDHCHETGKVRGLLCLKCNTKIAVLEDLKWVNRAKRYLAMRI